MVHKEYHVHIIYYTILKRKTVQTNRILVTYYYYNIVSSGVERKKTIFRSRLAWRNCVRILAETFLLLRTIILLLFDNARRTIIYILMLQLLTLFALYLYYAFAFQSRVEKVPRMSNIMYSYIHIHSERAPQTWPITHHDYLNIICEKRKLSSRHIRWSLLE